ncbi:MAG: hypothetical protein ACRD4E_12015, partial [Bryobacteraceae bacterium]
LKRLQEQVSVFGAASLPAGSHVGLPTGLSTGLSAGMSSSDGRLPISKLLDNTPVARPATPNRSSSLIPAHAGFGAQ